MSGLIRVGDFAPDFELPDQYGATVRLTRLLAAEPARGAVLLSVGDEPRPRLGELRLP